MNAPDEPRDDFHDDELSRRYRALSPERPHPETDAAIRAAAREAVAMAPRRRHNLTVYGGLAMAASVTLMVAILLPSWRSGVLREEVAVQDAPPAMAPAAESEAVMEEAVSARIMESPTTPAGTYPHAEVATAGALEEERSPARALNIQRKSEVASMPAPAPAPAAESVSESPVPAAPPAVSKPAVVASAPMPAFADADMAVAGARAQESRERAMEEQKTQMAARQELLARQKAGLARAPSEAQATAPQANEVDALLQDGRYGEALVRLQTGIAAADPALDSRRDLLRQLLPGQNKTLTCRPDSGPASSRTLCSLLAAYQAGRRPTEDAQSALRQALLAEGANPAPWLQAVSRLP